MRSMFSRSIRRRPRPARGRRTRVALGLCLSLVAVIGGCRDDADRALDVRMELVFDQSPPAVGEVGVTLELATAETTPLSGAGVRLEGNMNHAGMTPSFADLEETAPGRYTGTLDLTMGGDWIVIVTASMPDGRRLQRTIDVPGVKPR